ncbi:MAG TPA: caspase domain-containing protein [Pyrinomonadaceae bacterium]|nr:caspase domain-containing protein [Pyrinomonadaceae bacterium]
MKRLILVSFIFVLICAAATHAQPGKAAKSERRVALVIGNSSYASSPLKNPVNDAHDIGQALRGLGFDVIDRENVGQNDMKRAIREFGSKTKNSDVALFYYAGHAVQVNGENYLIPVGATIEKEEEVEYESVDVGFVLAQMTNAGSKTNIVILDACRNDPFARSFRSATRGLALMNAPGGTLIAYATAPGSVASDGNGRNGLYTQELLQNLRTPGLDVEEVFKRVRIAVREKTQGAQTPWESSSLVGSFHFTQPNVQVIFEEHFDNNDRGWLQFSNNDGSFSVSDGGFVMDSKSTGWWVATKPVAINQQDDFKIECSVTHVSGPNNFGFGLMWGVKDKSYNYFIISADGQFSVARVTEGVTNRVVPWAIPNSINRFSATNKLTIEKKGNELHFFVNDTFAAKIEFQPFFGDRVGFVLWNKQKIIFDDLVVTTQR